MSIQGESSEPLFDEIDMARTISFRDFFGDAADYADARISQAAVDDLCVVLAIDLKHDFTKRDDPNVFADLHTQGRTYLKKVLGE